MPGFINLAKASYMRLEMNFVASCEVTALAVLECFSAAYSAVVNHCLVRTQSENNSGCPFYAILISSAFFPANLIPAVAS